MELGDGDTKTSLQLGDNPPGSSISGELPIGSVASCGEGTTAADGGGFPICPRGNRGEIARDNYLLLDTEVV